MNSFTGAHFVQNLLARESRLHEWIMKTECPAQIQTFLYNSEGKVYSFDPNGVMKLSHEAWRPENRELVKNICPVGNMILHFWCAHKFLYKAGVPEYPTTEPTRIEWLRGWYSHMRSLQQLLDQEEIQKCLPRSSFPFNQTSMDELVAWTYKTIGNSSLGEEPRLLFNSATGLIHIPSFAFAGALRHNRRNVHPKNRVCIPMADPSCWPTTAVYQADSCSLCCDPNKGPFGDAACWRSGRTYERCCQQDFRNVKCEEIRKSTPGCIDCPQSLSFFCEEAHKFDAVKAWQHMNETYHEYLAELNTTRDLKLEIETNKTQLASLEPIFHHLISTQVVPNQTLQALQTSRSDFSRFTALNRTLTWLMTDIRPPVASNHSVVAKELKSLTDKRKSANTTLHDNVRKEQLEKERKIWATQRLVNNSIEIVSVKSGLDSIDFSSDWHEGNNTLGKLALVNSSLVDLHADLTQVDTRLNQTVQEIVHRERELGISPPVAAGRYSDQLESHRKSVTVAREQLDRVNQLKLNCGKADSMPKQIQELDARLRVLPSEISGLETGILAIQGDLDLAIRHQDPQSIRLTVVEMHDMLESYSIRLSEIDEQLTNTSTKLEWLQWETFTAKRKLSSLKIQSGILKSQIRHSMPRPGHGDIVRITSEISELRNSASLQSKRNILGAARFLLTHFIESYLVKILIDAPLPLWLMKLLIELLPSFMLSSKTANFAKWETLLSQQRATAFTTSPVEAHRSLIQLKTTQVRTMRGQRKEALLNDWRHSLIKRELGLIKREIQTHEATVNELHWATIKLHSEVLSFIDQRIHHNKSISRLKSMIDTARHITQKRGTLEETNRKLAALSGSRAQIESELATMRGQLPGVKRSCRMFNEKAYAKAESDLDSAQASLKAIEQMMQNETEAEQILQESFNALRLEDHLLRELAQRRSELERKISSEISILFRNLTVERDLLLVALKHSGDALQSLHHRNDSLTRRLVEINIESPKLEAELAVKDELIFNTTIKQKESEAILLDLAPRISDKEFNLSMWTADLSLVDHEMSIVKSRLMESVQIQPLKLSEEFLNISHYVFETSRNLTKVQEGLVNSTRRTAELVDEFKRSEQEYFTKERELKEYAKLVEAGIIPRVNFTFEY